MSDLNIAAKSQDKRDNVSVDLSTLMLHTKSTYTCQLLQKLLSVNSLKIWVLPSERLKFYREKSITLSKRSDSVYLHKERF